MIIDAKVSLIDGNGIVYIVIDKQNILRLESGGRVRLCNDTVALYSRVAEAAADLDLPLGGLR